MSRITINHLRGANNILNERINEANSEIERRDMELERERGDQVLFTLSTIIEQVEKNEDNEISEKKVGLSSPACVLIM